LAPKLATICFASSSDHVAGSCWNQEYPETWEHEGAGCSDTIKVISGFQRVEYLGDPSSWHIQRSVLLFNVTNLPSLADINDVTLWIHIAAIWGSIPSNLHFTYNPNYLYDPDHLHSGIAFPCVAGNYEVLRHCSADIVSIPSANLAEGWNSIVIPEASWNHFLWERFNGYSNYAVLGMRCGYDVLADEHDYESDRDVGYGIHSYESDYAGGVNYKYGLVINHSTVEPFQIWIEGTKLHYLGSVFGEAVEYEIEGDLITEDVASDIYLWVNGTYLYYIDENGDKRRKQGTLKGDSEADKYSIKIVGNPWQTKFAYVGDDGKEYRIEGTLT